MQPELPWSMYIRTSTFEQGEKSSPLKQFLANVAWAKANGKTIPGIESAVVGNKVRSSDYIFIDAQSGTNDDRPDLKRFLALAKTGKVGGVVCYVVDRAARNMNDALKIHRDLKRMQVGFKFALQNFDDSPAGELMFRIFAAFAEFEVQLIAERTHDGMRKRVLGTGGKQDGKPRPHGDQALYGYRLEDGVPVEDAKEGPIARLYLRMALDAQNTAGRIAKALNEAGHRTRQGKPWRGSNISKNLRRAHTYAGTYEHRHGIQAVVKAHAEALKLMGSDAPALDLAAIEIIKVDAYPPMITREEANLILARAEKNRAEKRGQPTKQYVLSHYLYCDVCGERWYARAKRYRCGCVDLGKPRCRARSVGRDRMESAVIDGMKNYLRQPDVHYALAMADYNASRGSSVRSHGDIEKQVRALAKEQAHYDEQATAFRLTAKQREIARKKSRDLDLKIAELNAELRQSAVVTLPSESGIVAAFGQILAILDEMETFAEKRKFVEATIQRVDTDGRQVKVRGSFDLQALGNQTLKRGTYTIRQFDAGLNKSTPISINFKALIAPPKHTGGRPRKIA